MFNGPFLPNSRYTCKPRLVLPHLLSKALLFLFHLCHIHVINAFSLNSLLNGYHGDANSVYKTQPYRCSGANRSHVSEFWTSCWLFSHTMKLHHFVSISLDDQRSTVGHIHLSDFSCHMGPTWRAQIRLQNAKICYDIEPN